MAKRKTGVFHATELEYIKQHHEGMTVDQMAEALNRSPEAVKKQLFKIEGSYKQKEVVQQFERELMTRPYWKNMQKQYTADELEILQYHWIKYIEQFSKQEITHAEESQILKVIDLEIMLERIKLEQHSNGKQIADLSDAVHEELQKDDSQQDKMFIQNTNQQLMGLRAAMNSNNKTFTDLLKEHKELMKTLKSTRDQRLKDVEQKDVTFYGWLKKLADEKVRSKISRDAELMKIAVGNLKTNMGQYHTYEDGELDRPLLNNETVILDEETETQPEEEDDK